MIKNRKLASKNTNQAINMFKTFLGDNSSWHGKEVEFVVNIVLQKTCSTCGFVDKPKLLSVRSWFVLIVGLSMIEIRMRLKIF
ncbi:MAG: hypothetical protein LBD03_04380 [Methanobrevibacter sp.]|jgi:transposase|nr:hypothetical protein [Candidatus Methanovirga procula]